MRGFHAIGRMMSAMFVVLIGLTMLGCPGSRAPVDTSQAILVETGEVLADVDEIVEPAVTRAGERTRAEVREEFDCPPPGQPCPGALDAYVERMRPWDRLVAALAAFAGTLRTWERLNDTWRASGERPRNWTELVCEPFGEGADTILRFMIDLELDVPQALRGLSGQSTELCSLGVAVVDHLMSSGEEADDDR